MQTAPQRLALFLKGDIDEAERDDGEDIRDGVGQERDKLSNAVEDAAQRATEQEGDTLGEFGLGGDRWKIFFAHYLRQTGNFGNIEEDEEGAFDERDEVERVSIFFVFFKEEFGKTLDNRVGTCYKLAKTWTTE